MVTPDEPGLGGNGNRMSGRLTFNTDALPERDRFAAFCEEIIRRYTGLDMTTRDQPGFRAGI